jgi:hypothetical protein
MLYEGCFSLIFVKISPTYVPLTIFYLKIDQKHDFSLMTRK